jgi:hypothetical protein
MRAADDDTPTLPNDTAALRALLLETRALVDTLVAGVAPIKPDKRLGLLTCQR